MLWADKLVKLESPVTSNVECKVVAPDTSKVWADKSLTYPELEADKSVKLEIPVTSKVECKIVAPDISMDPSKLKSTSAPDSTIFILKRFAWAFWGKIRELIDIAASNIELDNFTFSRNKTI